jgi:hypothetical protein
MAARKCNREEKEVEDREMLFVKFKQLERARRTRRSYQRPLKLSLFVVVEQKLIPQEKKFNLKSRSKQTRIRRRAFGGEEKWWGKQDSNLRRHSQRIYSPPPLPLGTFPRLNAAAQAPGAFDRCKNPAARGASTGRVIGSGGFAVNPETVRCAHFPAMRSNPGQEARR